MGQNGGVRQGANGAFWALDAAGEARCFVVVSAVASCNICYAISAPCRPTDNACKAIEKIIL